MFINLRLILQQPGLNSRFFAGYKPEDFIGKVAIVASAGNNENVEYIALKRFYLGSPAFGLERFCFLLGLFFCQLTMCFSPYIATAAGGKSAMQNLVKSLARKVIEPCASGNSKFILSYLQIRLWISHTDSIWNQIPNRNNTCLICGLLEQMQVSATPTCMVQKVMCASCCIPYLVWVRHGKRRGSGQCAEVA